MANHDKTEKPTHRRVLKARSEGQFAVSKDFVSAMQFLFLVMLATSWAGPWAAAFRKATREGIERAFSTTNFENATATGAISSLFTSVFYPMAIAGLVLVATAMAVHFQVTRFGFSLKKLQWKFTNLNPAGKLKELPRRGFTSGIQAVVMLVVFGGTVYFIAKSNVNAFFSLPLAQLDAALGKVGLVFSDLIWKAAALFLVFGVVDLFRQRRRFDQQMLMTKKEVKDEAKDNEGNPHVRGKIRRLRRDLLRRRMMSAVPKATAIIVNPTHYAVAIQYQRESMSTPLVVAKGKNYLALRIRQLAIENQVPLVENPPLAQALYKSVEVGQEIPPDFYRAVAEILAYIYRLMKQ